MTRRSLSLAFIAGAFAANACGDDAADMGSDTEAMVCVPGKTEPCACPGGAEGAQACNADGSGYEACECPMTSAGNTDADPTQGETGTDDGETTAGETTGTVDDSTGTSTDTGGGQEIWLQNDGFVDNSNVGFQQGFVANECWASVYVPEAEHYPFEVTGVQMLVGGNTNQATFSVGLYDVDADNQPTTALDEVDVQITGADNALTEVDFGGVRLSSPVFDSGNFAVVVCLVGHSGLPAIARDDDGTITADRNWIRAEGRGWTQSQLFDLTGDWIMRARIRPV